MYDKALQEILEEARFRVQEIAVNEAYRLFKLAGQITFVDIREPEELSLGYIKGSVFIRGDELEMQARHLLPDKEAPLLLYCGSGVRSLLTAQTLKEMGYNNVRILAGGIDAWKEAGYEVITSGLLTFEQLNHYSRQVILRQEFKG